ncbi:AtpZ/AtpI family protein [Alsobacter sp. KACC 23698]|uniref:ATP synthase protein I n=1 Tax=Alsobacter sp. KACC 23698 TaxID=3149229 RepID=A0AAU7JH74_9HYPH
MSDGTPNGNGDKARASQDVELSARLDRLGKRLDQVRETGQEQQRSRETSGGDPSAMGKAFRLSTEFVAGIIAGCGLGWAFDAMVGSKPWGLIVGLMLGFGAGVWNVMRASGFTRPPKS